MARHSDQAFVETVIRVNEWSQSTRYLVEKVRKRLYYWSRRRVNRFLIRPIQNSALEDGDIIKQEGHCIKPLRPIVSSQDNKRASVDTESNLVDTVYDPIVWMVKSIRLICNLSNDKMMW